MSIGRPPPEVDGSSSSRASPPTGARGRGTPVSSGVRGRFRTLLRRLGNKRFWGEVYLCFEDSQHSRTASLLHRTAIVVIMWSIFTFALQTEPYFQSGDYQREFFASEVFCTVFFSLEYVLHICVVFRLNVLCHSNMFL